MPVASQRRNQILEAARACMSESGPERLTLRKVAERAQVSHATVAYYFQTRQNLIDAALLETSQEFMGALLQRELVYGPDDLRDLVETFLDAGNPSARFVVQMIDAGLRDLQLRPTHDEFIAYGRDRIERSIRVGIEMGSYRRDIDPKLGAALIHTILIWWQSEVAAGATSRELALEIGRLALKLLEPSHSEMGTDRHSRPRPKNAVSDNGAQAVPTSIAPVDAIEASLVADPRLSPQTARTLSETFRNVYNLATGLSQHDDEQ